MCWILTVPVLVTLRLCAEAALSVLKCHWRCALTSQLQVFRHEPYNEKCDVYSFAMICSHLGFTQSPRCLLFSGQPCTPCTCSWLGAHSAAAQPAPRARLWAPRGAFVSSANKTLHSA